jgi:hypothetical protein
MLRTSRLRGQVFPVRVLETPHAWAYRGRGVSAKASVSTVVDVYAATSSRTQHRLRVLGLQRFGELV